VAAAELGRTGRVYNFGGSTERTNLSVVRELLGILGRPEALIEFVTDRPGHDRRYAIDASRAREELGWRPEVDFGEGLKGTVDWYRSHGAWCAEVTASR
jgi:dTDP-glucose 4,6-dehydratase